MGGGRVHVILCRNAQNCAIVNLVRTQKREAWNYDILQFYKWLWVSGFSGPVWHFACEISRCPSSEPLFRWPGV